MSVHLVSPPKKPLQKGFLPYNKLEIEGNKMGKIEQIGDIKKGIDRYATLNNDNVSNIYINNNDNVKIQHIKNKSMEKSKQVDYIADRLVEAFNNPQARSYYCKLAWKLPESAIWSNYEQALSGKKPINLFTYLCERTINGR